MAYQSRRDKHRATPREFRVVNATAAHDFVLEVPGETRLFILLDIARQTNIAAAAYRDVQRWTGATGICQRICKAHVFDETFRINSAFNAKIFVAAPPAVAMEFDLFGERRSSHWVKGGGVSKTESGSVIGIANCKLRICSIRDEE
jgi:hypothetical protein